PAMAAPPPEAPPPQADAPPGAPPGPPAPGTPPAPGEHELVPWVDHAVENELARFRRRRRPRRGFAYQDQQEYEYETKRGSQPMVLSFRVPDAPYSDRLFSVLHKTFEAIDGVQATLEIFGVELTGLAGVVVAPLAAMLANFMALGAGYAEARAEISKDRV